MNTQQLIEMIVRHGWKVVIEPAVGDNEGFVELTFSQHGRQFKSIQPAECAAAGGIDSSLRQFATNGMAPNL